MRETRKTIKAENTQLRAQIAVHEHSTRKALHEHIALIAGRNTQLIADYEALEAKCVYLSSKYDALVAASATKPTAA